MNHQHGRRPGPWRRPRDLALAAVMTTLALAAGTACAPEPRVADPAPSGGGAESVNEAPPPSPGGRYVALGSSMASGPGLPPIVDEQCQRSGNNYPQQVATQLDLTLTDVTCGGASTDNVVSVPQELDPARPPQLEAVTADTEIVTVTVGGNDIQYTTLLDTYAYACAGGDCSDVSVDRTAIGADLASVGTRMTTMLEAITTKAPGAQVLVVSYPRIVPSTGVSCPSAPFPADDVDYLRSVGEQLDAAIRDAAARSGVQLVDVYGASSELGACEGDRPWVTGIPSADDPPGTLSFHATPAGMEAIAQLVVRKIRTGS